LTSHPHDHATSLRGFPHSGACQRTSVVNSSAVHDAVTTTSTAAVIAFPARPRACLPSSARSLASDRISGRIASRRTALSACVRNRTAISGTDGINTIVDAIASAPTKVP
jgi:hypothetical protein